MKNLLALFLIAILAVSMTTSCKKEKGNPPTLPIASSMTIDFSNFEASSKSAGMVLPKGVNEINWDYAALVASYWDAIITGTLVVPVTAYKLAIDQTPTYVSTKTWKWSYTASVASVSYTARLTGEITSSNVVWNMYLSESGGYSDFKWFTGTSSLDGTSGQWILNISPTNDNPILQINWYKSSTDIDSIRYTYVRTLTDSGASDPFNGSYIKYGLTTGTYNAYYNVYFYYLTGFYNANIDWSTTGIIGKVQCLNYFGDNNWYCWDANHVDATCTQ
jgi:hypothetical protein